MLVFGRRRVLQHFSHLRRHTLCTANGFSELGLHPLVVDRLQDNGFTQPTDIQRSGILAMVKKGPESAEEWNFPQSLADVVIGGETGSGKTLAYLAPIVSSFFHLGENKTGAKRVSALVLCPNNILCEQVAGVAEEIFGGMRASDEPNAPELRVRTIRAGALHRAFGHDKLKDVNGEQKGYTVVVSTPGSFLRLIECQDRGNQKSMVRKLHHIVFDEADILLTAYDSDMRRLWALLALGTYHDTSFHGFMGYKRKDLGGFISKLYSRKMRSRDHQSFAFVAATLPTLSEKSAGSIIRRALPHAAWAGSDRLHEVADDEERFQAVASALQQGPIAKRAAEAGAGAVGTGAGTEEAVGASAGAQEQEQGHGHGQEAGGAQGARPKALVFCKSVPRVDKLKKHLRARGVPAMSFHRRIPFVDQRLLLEAFEAGEAGPFLTALNRHQHGQQGEQQEEQQGGQQGEAEAETEADVEAAGGTGAEAGAESGAEGGSEGVDEGVAEGGTELPLVLVCTDAAARGLDLQQVGHVVQADFAASAIDYLHRAGRTGRAGRGGCVTNLHTEDDAELVEVLREAIVSQTPVEHVFSRRRSFKGKIKKARKKEKEAVVQE